MHLAGNETGKVNEVKSYRRIRRMLFRATERVMVRTNMRVTSKQIQAISAVRDIIYFLMGMRTEGKAYIILKLVKSLIKVL